MTEFAVLLSCIGALAILAIVAMVALPSRVGSAIRALLADRLDGFERGQERLERVVREEISKNRDEGTAAAHRLREEVRATLKDSTDSSLRSLAAFDRIHLAPGESARVELRLPPESFASITDKGTREYRPGAFEVSIGGGQPLAGVATTSDVVLGRVELRAAE